MPKIPAKRLRDIIDSLEPSVAKAFLDSMADITDSIIISQLITALDKRDIDVAIAVLNIDDAAFAPLRAALTNAYVTGGALGAGVFKAAKDVSGARVVVRFDLTNPQAERQIGQLVSRITGQISQQSRNAVRETVLAGYQQGRGPRDIALDIAGRINKATGRREGGIISISDKQAADAANFRSRLTSGDPEKMKAALRMKLRDKRFDRTIIKAIEDGKPISKADADKMFARYSDNALRLRAETIARTETGNAVMRAQHEAFRQGLEKTGHTEDAVTRTWRDSGDSRVRESHDAMNGQTVKGLQETFVTPEGAQLMRPLDSSLGAPLDEIISCRCVEEVNIDFTEDLT